MNYTDRINGLTKRHEKLKEYYFSQKGRQLQLVEAKDKMAGTLKSLKENGELLDQVKVLLQKASEYAREQSRQQIEALVTNCLQYIFDSDMEFKIEISETRGRPEAEFYVVTRRNDTIIKTRPQDARGGGIVDIISLALRVSMLQCANTCMEGPIILDEPAKHVSDEYIVRVGEFLKQVSKMFDRQVIMVTHDRHLSEIADKSFRIELRES